MDDDMDATFREVRSRALSNSVNKSNDLYECAEGADSMNEGTAYNLILRCRWMREHYTKLTNNNRARCKARCNHCNRNFNTSMNRLHILHKHLVDAHRDKLTEEEKNEKKFHWVWNYYIKKSKTEARCKLCNVTVRYNSTTNLTSHLKKHHEVRRTSDIVIDNKSSSDDDMDADNITLKKAKRQEASFHSTNLSDSFYECAEETEAINEGTYNFIPTRRWMREHYTKSTRNNRARCNHCNEKFNIDIRHSKSLHKHLVEAHPDELTEEQKKEMQFYWIWDHYIAKSNMQRMQRNSQATCKRCKKKVTYCNLISHLKIIHKISSPTDNVIESSSDDDMDTATSKAKRQKVSSNSTNKSNNCECTEETGAMNRSIL